MFHDMTTHLPVICDRCRAEGLAGDDPFEAFGALLDFEPVPRRKTRPDGWGEDVQRAYVAALSLAGSDRAACRAVGKSTFGVTQLLRSEGSEGFAAAREEALAMAADERGRRLAEGLRAVAAEQSAWRPPTPPWAAAVSRGGRPPGRAAFPPPPPEPTEEEQRKAKLDFLRDVVRRYMIKIRQEREARLNGEIVLADMYVRQITWLECALEVTGEAAFDLLASARLDGHALSEIAETPMSRLLGEARRRAWREMGEPDRPEHPPRDYLRHHPHCSTEPTEAAVAGLEIGMDEQWQRFRERHERDAKAQVEWETRAREQSAQWRARIEAGQKAPPSAEGDGEGGEPPSVDGGTE